MPAPPVIIADRLTKRFGSLTAVDAASFAVPRGATVGLLGGNGAGKTTTIAMLLGLLLPSAGRALVLGHDMARDRQAVLGRMNFSSPYVELPHRLTVRQNLEVFARLYAVPERAGRIAELAHDLQFQPLLDRPLGELSAGQKTRVALAKALINRPEVLLVDEPTASLDPDTGDCVRAYLEAFRQRSGTTILLASHNMAEVERLCDEVLFLRRGRIVDQGDPAALVRRHGSRDLEAAFLAVARAPLGSE